MTNIEKLYAKFIKLTDSSNAVYTTHVVDTTADITNTDNLLVSSNSQQAMFNMQDERAFEKFYDSDKTAIYTSAKYNVSKRPDGVEPTMLDYMENLTSGMIVKSPNTSDVSLILSKDVAGLGYFLLSQCKTHMAKTETPSHICYSVITETVIDNNPSTKYKLHISQFNKGLKLSGTHIPSMMLANQVLDMLEIPVQKEDSSDTTPLSEDELEK